MQSPIAYGPSNTAKLTYYLLAVSQYKLSDGRISQYSCDRWRGIFLTEGNYLYRLGIQVQKFALDIGMHCDCQYSVFARLYDRANSRHSHSLIETLFYASSFIYSFACLYLPNLSARERLYCIDTLEHRTALLLN